MQQQSLIDILSQKQFRIAILVAQGLTDQEIGKIVGQTSGVMRNYLRCLMDEVGCWNRLELAIRFAHELHEGCYNCSDYMAHLCSLSKTIKDLGIGKTITQAPDRRDFELPRNTFERVREYSCSFPSNVRPGFVLYSRGALTEPDGSQSRHSS